MYTTVSTRTVSNIRGLPPKISSSHVQFLRSKVRQLEEEVSRLQGQMQLWPAPPPPPLTATAAGGSGDGTMSARASSVGEASPPCVVM